MRAETNVIPASEVDMIIGEVRGLMLQRQTADNRSLRLMLRLAERVQELETQVSTMKTVMNRRFR